MEQPLVQTIPHLTGLEVIADRYRAVLCDLWGVVHNGVAPYETAVHALMRYREQGGIVLLLSNAPRPGPSIHLHLLELGVPDEAFDQIVSSGDLVQAHLMGLGAGGACYHMGPERDLPLFDGLDLRRVSMDDAEFIVCSGLVDDEAETPDDYRTEFEAGLARDLTMICANPDRQVVRGDRVIYCGGALAAVYEEMGGRVVWFGKPYPKTYEAVFRILEDLTGDMLKGSSVLAIGDGLNTDIPGAQRAGIDSLLITGGLHFEEFGSGPEHPVMSKVEDVCRARDLRPVGYQARLIW